MTQASLIALIVPGFFISFALFWSMVVFLIARIGGWASLARQYPATTPPSGKSFQWRSARFGYLGSYRNTLEVTLSPAGLYMRPVIFFRMGHDPVLIPWNAIADADRSDQFFVSALRLSIRDGNSGDVRNITFYGQPLVDAIEAYVRPGRNGRARDIKGKRYQP